MVSCSLFEYDDPSESITNSLPETYLALMSGDTIYHVITDIIEITDTVSNITYYDTLWSYLIEDVPDSVVVMDTITHAFTESMTSMQVLSWWGEDIDGQVVGYYYKWNVDNDWTYTNDESKLFFVPIRSSFDVFSFQVKAVDNSAEWIYDTPVIPIKDDGLFPDDEFIPDDEFFSDIGDSSNIYDVIIFCI